MGNFLQDIFKAVSGFINYIIGVDTRDPVVEPTGENDPVTTAKRGDWLPRMVGKRRLGARILWVGDRTWIGNDGWEESAWHGICIGPAYEINVFIDGEGVSPAVGGPLSQALYPSGTDVLMSDGSTVSIYWGEPDQPVNEWLSRSDLNVIANGFFTSGLTPWTDESTVGGVVTVAIGKVELELPVTSTAIAQIDQVALVIGTDYEMVYTATESASASNPFYNVGGTDVALPLGVAQTILFTASGTTLQFKNIGVSGPANSLFLDGITVVDVSARGRTTIRSRWPNLCYLVWKDRSLGTSNPRWPSIEYDVEVRPEAAPVGEILFYENSERWMGSAPGFVSSDGPNTAFAIREFLIRTPPHGLGISHAALSGLEDMVSIGLFEDVVRSHFLAQKGQTAAQILDDLLYDSGFGVYSYALGVGGLLRFVALRESISYPTFTADAIQSKAPEIEVLLRGTQPDGVLYRYANSARGFAQDTIAVNDDGLAAQEGRRKKRVVDLPTVVDEFSAEVAGSRRELELLSLDGSIQIVLMFEGRLLRPGDVFSLITVPFILRALTMKRSIDSPLVHIRAIKDPYAATSSTPTGVAIGGGSSSLAAADDNYMVLFEVPSTMNPLTDSALWVIRHRAHIGILGSQILLSEDDATFIFAETERTTVFGGTLAELIISSGSDITTGPVVQVNLDADIASTTTLDDTSWAAGAQILLVNGELMYVQDVVDLGGGYVRLDGLKRAKEGTSFAAHAVTDRVSIFGRTDLPMIYHPFISTGVTVYSKPLAFTNTDIVEEASVASDGLTLS